MKTVKIGNLILGDKREIYVQSMLSVRRDDVEGAVLQAKSWNPPAAAYSGLPFRTEIL